MSSFTHAAFFDLDYEEYADHDPAVGYVHPHTPQQALTPTQDFVAGTVAGIAITIVGHPFDTVKVRLQTSTAFRGGIDCLMRTIRKEGVRILAV